MPSCFQLTRKGEDKPAILQEVDKELCDYLGVPCDDLLWVGNWYNTIGLGLAIGHDWVKLREYFPEKNKIIDYLSRNYTTDSWKEWK